MRALFLCLPVLLAAAPIPFSSRARAAEIERTNAPACIELSDQYELAQRLSFPATNVTLLTIADKAGSAQIANWVAPIKQHFSQRIDIRGIADVSAVPVPLRGLVRREFRKSQSYPVMMDWAGSARRAFGYSSGQALILVINQRGGILRRFTGPANDRALGELIDILNHELRAGGS